MKLPKFSLKIGVVALVFVGLFSASLFFGFQYFKNKGDAAQGDAQKIVEAVSKLVLLPQGETPQIATVSDVTKLKAQTFFQNAENGDKVLIFQNARRAILYRPSTGKVIEIGPVGAGGEASASAVLSPQAEETVEPFTVSIYNGTTTAGLAAKMEATIKGKSLKLEIKSLGNAKGKDYKKTLVVAVGDNQESNAKTLADAIGAEVGQIPESEDFSSSGADIVVIVGSDAI